VNDLTNKWVDISTIIAATAGLWALAFAWLTYWKAVVQQKQEEFRALSSIVAGLQVELELMKDWTGAGGEGYPKEIKPPPEWSQPGRLIWKFDIQAVSQLTRSSFLYRLGDIVEPFARLNFSVSRLFQLHDEYRAFANSNPGVFASPPDWYTAVILGFNVRMHVNLIGGADSSDPMCLYKTYDAAVSALRRFKGNLLVEKCHWWFWIGHLLALTCFAAGILLLIRLFRP
jgi:hypothetical protein